MNTSGKLPSICTKLQEALERCKPILFDCVGGCGIDTSLGKNPCMEAVGLWFKFCPFCGSKIISSCKDSTWEWHEEERKAVVTQ